MLPIYIQLGLLYPTQLYQPNYIQPNDPFLPTLGLAPELVNSVISNLDGKKHVVENATQLSASTLNMMKKYTDKIEKTQQKFPTIKTVGFLGSDTLPRWIFVLVFQQKAPKGSLSALISQSLSSVLWPIGNRTTMYPALVSHR